MLVARTDTEAAKHKGLTYFICDMEQEGVPFFAQNKLLAKLAPMQRKVVER